MLNTQPSLGKHLDFMIADLIILELSFLLSVCLRDPLLIRSRVYLNVALTIPLIGFFVSVTLSSYSGILRRNRIEELKQVIVQISMIAVIEALFFFLVQYAETFSRLSFLYFIVLAMALTYAERICFKTIIRKRKTEPKQSIFVVTASGLAGETIRNLHIRNFDNFYIRGLILTDGDRTGDTIENVPVVCSAAEAAEYIQREWVDAVFLRAPGESDGGMDAAAGEAADAWLNAFTDCCEEMGVPLIQTLPGIPLLLKQNEEDCQPWKDETLKNMRIARVGPYAVLIRGPYLHTMGQVFTKRLLDIAGGIVGTVMTGLFAILLGPLIYIASPGNIFFTQTRIGRNGKKFKLYKFRSMVPDAEEKKSALMASNKMSGPIFKVDNDPRIIGSGPDGTRHGIGWFIRTFSIDEFPQFFNVLKGDMSLVGTRPPTVDEWEKYEPRHRARMAIRPGITGLWQISGRSQISDFEEVVRLDKKYISTWSIGGDILILFKTIETVFRSVGAE